MILMNRLESFLSHLSAAHARETGACPERLLKRVFEQRTGHPANPAAPKILRVYNARPDLAAVEKILPAWTASASNIFPGAAGGGDADGVLRVPFGDWPVEALDKDGNKIKCIQRLDAVAAAEMTKGWRGLLQRFAMWLIRIPIYEGHPDCPDALDEDDKEVLTLGWVKKMEVDGESLILRPAWNAAGLDVREKYTAHSPHWWLADTGEARGGLPIYRPIMLVSIGLTNTPNIVGSAINENENQNEGNRNMEKLIEMLRKELGLAADLSDEEVLKRGQEHYSVVLDELWQLRDSINASEARAQDAEKAAEKLTEKLNAAAASATAANEKLTTLTAEATAANEARTTAAAQVVDDAIKAGKIQIAKRDEWLAYCAADPIAAALAAANEQPRLKTDPDHATAVNTRSDLPPAKQFAARVREMLRERGMAHTSDNWTRCWNELRASQPELYGLMQQSIHSQKTKQTKE